MRWSGLERRLSFGLAILFFLTGLTACGSEGNSGKNGFDLSKAIIPRAEILRGGPPRDGIPALDKPTFVSAAAVNFLKDDDLLVSVSAGGETRGYPLRILVWHELVNDRMGDKAFAVTFCPLCGTAMVFDRRMGEEVLDFGVSGLLYRSDVLMFDRQSESLWSQLAMKAVAGEKAGTPLTWVPSEHVSWKSWRKSHPEGKVLSLETGYSRNYFRDPYAGYEDTPETMFPVPEKRTELSNKDWILGILVNGHAKAYPFSRLPSGGTVRDKVEGKRLLLRYDWSTHSGSVEEVETGKAVPAVSAYWFAWQAFYPRTELYSRR